MKTGFIYQVQFLTPEDTSPKQGVFLFQSDDGSDPETQEARALAAALKQFPDATGIQNVYGRISFFEV